MARSYKLTWQPGGGHQTGRWRKKYQGKVYYFPGGRGKSDRDAYQADLDAWEKKKAQVDAATPKPHEAEYVRAIAEWETVLTWCRKHHDEEMAIIATEKLDRLRRSLAVNKPEPLKLEDTFAGRFDAAARYPGLDEIVASLVVPWNLSEPSDKQPAPATVVNPRQLRHADMSDPLATEEAIWKDLLAVMQQDVPQEKTVGAQVDRFLATKSADAAAGQRSKGRSYLLKLYLTHFGDWLGRGTSVIDINAPVLSDYRLELLKKIEAGEWSRTTASHRLEGIKTFVRWLWRMEMIPAIPRNMDGKSGDLKINEAKPRVVVYTKDEIKKLLKGASDRTQLYILLSLNAAFTQKDIADLKHDEVDWTAGRITRKRSKTDDEENVPEVSYKLWPETLRLLKQERAKSGIEVLRNENGERLWYDRVVDGKYTKIDNVSCAFGRLCRKLKIKKPIKSLKKTSATLIRNNAKYASLEDLFLGHAPRKLSDKHYTLAPAVLLDEAIAWLGRELGIVEVKTKKEPSKSSPEANSAEVGSR